MIIHCFFVVDVVGFGGFFWREKHEQQIGLSDGGNWIDFLPIS